MRATRTAATAGTKPLWKRNPTAVPTPIIRATTKMLRTRSAMVRPAKTAERAIGSDRNLDRPAEDVAEQQDEHDGLHRGEDQQLGCARDGAGPKKRYARTRENP